MKNKIIESVEIPAGVDCHVHGNILKCKKDSAELSREIIIPGTKITVEGNSIIFTCEKGNKKQYNFIKSNVAHIKNMFLGLNKKYVYKLQACNVHFPMTLKVDKDKLVISNFLGEKKQRIAHIVHGADVVVSGQNITVSSHSKEVAGQTAANMEKVTKIRNRDRRIFQDGIYITEKSGGSE